MSNEGIYEDYKPAPVPLDLVEVPRYLDDELNRIAELKAKKEDSAVMAIKSAAAVIMGPPPGAWDVLYTGVPETWDAPVNSWNPTTAEWTCLVTGLYQIAHFIRVDNVPGAQGQRGYTVAAAIEVNGAIGDAWVFQYVADDTKSGAAQITVTIPFDVGDKIRLMGDVIHDQFTVAADVFAYTQLKKEI